MSAQLQARRARACGRARFELDLPVHDGHELAGDREPETAPRRDATLGPVEAVEDVGRVLGRNPGPVVLHLEVGVLAVGVCPQRHLRPGRRVHESVVDERA